MSIAHIAVPDWIGAMMSDLISRQDALNQITAIDTSIIPYVKTREYVDVLKNYVIKTIETLPSAEPKRKIIYCKDCRFAHLTVKGRVKYCDVWFPETKTYLDADNFCSSAEKRGE